MKELDEFHTVRVLCRSCGWFRVLGYTGVKGKTRALIRIDTNANQHNLLRGKVREVSIDSKPAQWPKDYSDLKLKAHEMGLYQAQALFDPLLEGRSCPRCQHDDKLTVDWFLLLGGDPLVEKRRTLG